VGRGVKPGDDSGRAGLRLARSRVRRRSGHRGGAGELAGESIGPTQLVSPSHGPTFPHDLVPGAVAHARAEDAAQGLESGRTSPGSPLAGRLQLEPPLEEGPSLVLAEVHDRCPGRLLGVPGRWASRGPLLEDVRWGVPRCERTDGPGQRCHELTLAVRVHTRIAGSRKWGEVIRGAQGSYSLY